MQPKIHIETDRLILRNIEASDRDNLWVLDSDAEVHKYLGNKPVTEMAQIDAVIEMICRQYIDFGIGRWAVIEKSSGAFVGWSGLKYITEETNGVSNYYDLGYRICRAFWRKGYATESAVAVAEYADRVLQIPLLYSAAHIENMGSNTILRNLGFVYQSQFFWEQELCNWYQRIRQL